MHDTSIPMDLSLAGEQAAEQAAEDESAWEISSPDVPGGVNPSDGDYDPESSQPPASSEDEASNRMLRPGLSGPGAEMETQINFITRRQRRPMASDRSSRNGWQRASDRTRITNLTSSFGRVRQDFLKKNNCWNCGKPGHFLVECPYQKGNGTAALSEVSPLKPISKKF